MKYTTFKSFSLSIVLSLLILPFTLFSQNDLTFKNNDKVVFIGNSITASGLYHMNIQSYYQTRFPERNIEFYNCGISGDVASGVIARLDWDILPLNPTVAVIKLGMNDSGSGIYDRKYTPAELQAEQSRIIDKYRAELKIIIKRLKAKCNPKFILIKPTPYDETAKLPKKPQIGRNETIKLLGGVINELAIEYNASVVDFFKPLNDINLQQQKIDSTFTMIGNDRVHPAPTGHLIMAYEFLKAQQVPELVSKIELNARGAILKPTTNASMSNFKNVNGKITFEIVENSLPFPIPADAIDALKFKPVNSLNKEILVIKGLKKGNYSFKIDNVEIGKFTNKELNTGVDFGALVGTPQQMQAQKVLEIIKSIYYKKSKIRATLMAKIMLEKDNIDINNAEMLQAYIDKKRKQNPYYETVINGYLENKDKIDEMKMSINSNQSAALIQSGLRTHIFSIEMN